MSDYNPFETAPAPSANANAPQPTPTPTFGTPHVPGAGTSPQLGRTTLSGESTENPPYATGRTTLSGEPLPPTGHPAAPLPQSSGYGVPQPGAYAPPPAQGQYGGGPYTTGQNRYGAQQPNPGGTYGQPPYGAGQYSNAAWTTPGYRPKASGSGSTFLGRLGRRLLIRLVIAAVVAIAAALSHMGSHSQSNQPVSPTAPYASGYNNGGSDTPSNNQAEPAPAAHE